MPVIPKYKKGDTVKFKYEGRQLPGEIFNVDAHGTLEQSEEPSYDILAKGDEACLYKHIRESLIGE